ncbi:MAG: HAD family phosphatase [Bacteroidota bacterium]|nr:HAD family phosphatase [Bacteroidota bacterium]
MQNIETIVFDLGGVLIDWNPSYLYKQLIVDENEREYFLKNICTPDWNEEQDAGRPLQEATNILVGQFPEQRHLIEAFYGRWEEMLGGPIQETVEIFSEIKGSKKFRLYALTNWSHETFHVALKRYEFLQWFDGIVVSGEEKTRKPFPQIYEILLSRYEIVPGKTLFIDDNQKNIIGAQEAGINTIHFKDPKQLKDDLKKRGI